MLLELFERVEERSRLEQRHPHPKTGQHVGHGAPASAGANHHNVVGLRSRLNRSHIYPVRVILVDRRSFVAWNRHRLAW